MRVERTNENEEVIRKTEIEKNRCTENEGRRGSNKKQEIEKRV